MLLYHPDEPNAYAKEVADEKEADRQKEFIFRNFTVDRLYKEGYLEGFIETLTLDMYRSGKCKTYEKAEKDVRNRVQQMTLDTLWDMTPEPLDWSELLEKLNR